MRTWGDETYLSASAPQSRAIPARIHRHHALPALSSDTRPPCPRRRESQHRRREIELGLLGNRRLESAIFWGQIRVQSADGNICRQTVLLLIVFRISKWVLNDRYYKKQIVAAIQFWADIHGLCVIVNATMCLPAMWLTIAVINFAAGSLNLWVSSHRR